jgi:hypothetical protein
MSEMIYLKSIPASSQAGDEIIYCQKNVNSQKKNIISKNNNCFSMFFNTNNSNQNVGKDKEIKSGLKLFNTVEPKQQEESTSINNIQSAYNNSPLNLENNKENYCYDINFKTKSLELQKDSFDIFGDSLHKSEFENHLYSKSANNKFNDHFLNEIPTISKIFSEKIKIPKNFISFNLYFKNNVYKPKDCKLFKSNLIIEKITSFTNEKPENLQNQFSKLNFNVPENFLIKFNIKSINSENMTFKQNDLITNKISLKDMEIYINKICNNNSKNYLDFSNEEYIELKKVDNEQSKKAEFLQYKRKNSSNFEENENEKTNYSSEDINPNGGRRKPLKKNCKNNNKKLTLKNKQIIKNNNKKNGPKISLYLNQIQINKNKLEQFPFCKLLNVKENIKIDLLKGITEKKDLIKIKRKPEIINHQKNLKFILNKKFEIIYEKNEDQYILFINGINILHLILYYYYQIQEEVKLINKYHYSHASYKKSNIVKNHIENLIKKCNKIVKEISKEEH